MDSVVHQALADQVIKYDDVFKRFECLICEVKLSGEPSAKDHLISKQHREVGARKAIKSFSMSPNSIKDLLPESVKDAVNAGDISVMESKEILCHVCNTPSTGVVSLKDHLLSNNHLKKKNARPQTTSLEARVPASSSFTSTNAAVQQAISERIVHCIDATDLQCVLCDLKFTGEVSLEQHLESKKHREVGARLAISNFTSAPRSLIEKLPPAVKENAATGNVTVTESNYLLCNICNVSLNGVVSLNDHLIGDDHRKKKNNIQMITQQPAIPPPSPRHPELPSGVNDTPISPPLNGASLEHNTQLSDTPLHGNPEIDRVLAEDIIIETDNRMGSFLCKLCEKKFNNDGPLLDHLKSKKHLQKEKIHLDCRSLPQPISDPDEPSVPEEGAKSLPRMYSVISDTRGHVYIFNYTFKGTQKVRKGAEHDSKNIRDTFSRMGYEVFVHEDLTQEETNQELVKIQRKPELNEIDSFIMFFLSHGKDEYTFFANDEEEMDLRLIRRKFTDRKCPYLRGKPKIFLVNYCRGDQMQKKEIEFDDIEVPNDMVTIHAATEGILARRHPTSGTIFVASLCEVIKAHARNLDLRNIYHELEEKMKESKGTKPMWEDYGFKPFCFNPT